MPFPLLTQPYSIAGSYLALGYLDERRVSEHVVLRSVQGDSLATTLLTIKPAAPSAERAAFTPEGGVAIPTADGRINARFTSTRRLEVAGDVGYSLDLRSSGAYDAVVSPAPGMWEVLRYSASVHLQIRVLAGVAELWADFDGARHTAACLNAAPGTVLEVRSVQDSPLAAPDAPPLMDFADWLALAPPAAERFAPTRELAAYVTWSAMVAPSGLVRRPSMFMSKNWMTNVWSWDHCFNALALAGSPELAWGQFMTAFDHQGPAGNLQDSFNDATATYCFTKPPVHGWTLAALWDKGVVTDARLAEVYGPLSAWTNWWLTERTAPGRTLPHYLHGNDSGWDNSTVFIGGKPVESPDLAALLVIQLEVLARIAGELGRESTWAERAEDLLRSLLATWDGTRFVAHDVSGKPIEHRSLLEFVTLVLGHRLPDEIRNTLIGRLATQGHLTEHGLATEPPDSPLYVPDGYWRGPIWAPSTYLILDSLRACGASALAKQIAESFCSLVAGAGMAENFDALTGAGLRDRAYTWTASVFLLLASWLSQ
ncbi:MAG: hypothetical protein LBR58_07530 [Propionibacteriaceae bacterium]|jgi:hypothetical protein|nr:hypothetical protein [Propionibacteriaceae bacterium]